MNNNLSFKTLTVVSLLLVPLFTAAPAHAGLEACNNIDVEANATCTVEVKDCDISCEPVHVTAACAAELQVSCDGSCPKVPSIECTGSCQGSCEADCNVKPAEFDCKASCTADADANCDGQCNSSGDKTQCKASCKATFAAKCDASCTGKPGSVDCKAKCQGKCEGSCTAQKELQCQVDCQSMGYAECKARVTGGCKGDCSDPKGALFCDGEYIDHNGSVDACIDAIKAAFPDVKVDASARGESSCKGSTCEASGEADASASCAFSPRRANGTDLASGFGAIAALGVVFMRRRKSR